MSDAFVTHGYIAGCTLAVQPVESKDNLFKKSDAFVNEMRNKTNLVCVFIDRPGVSVEPTETVGSPGFTMFRYKDEYNVTRIIRTRDFLINVKDYAINAGMVMPERFDRIREIDEAEGYAYNYEVASINEEPEWRYSGTYRHAYRVHTKFIDREVYIP